MKKGIPFLGLFTFLVLFAVISPILVILPTSMTAANYLSFPPEGLSLKWYARILERREFIESFWFSMQLALISAVLATLLGTLAGIALHRYRFPFARTLNALILSPLTVPSIIIGIAALLFFTKTGIAGTFTGLLLSHLLISVPYVVRLVLTGLSNFDYTLERAAAILGAGPFHIFRHITVPLLKPAILSGFLFAFLTSFDNVTVSLFLITPTMKTLPLTIYYYMQESLDPLVASVSSAMILLSLAFIFVLERIYGLDRLFGIHSHAH